MKTFLILLLSCAISWAKLPIRTYLNSSYLVPGEVTYFVIETTGQITSDFQVPDTENYTLRYRSNTPFRGADNATGYRYFFELSSLYQGAHEIPALEIKINGERRVSHPLTFQVVSSDTLHFDTVKIGNQDITYATSVFLPDRDLYVGETVPSEVKVYLPYMPRNFTVIESGLPDIKRDGVSAWRFQTPRGSAANTPFLFAKGRYFAITYRSSARALTPGKVSLGGGSARPVFKSVMNKNGRTQWVDQPIYLPFKKAERTALPLPAGAPNSFKGAVGKFDLEVELDGTADANPNSPLSSRLIVYGTGNLDTIQAPVITNSKDWKLYPATKTQRDSERRFLSGTVEFTQLLRAKSKQDRLPPFEFSFFDPATKSYQTLTSPEILLNSDVQAIIVEDEELTGSEIAPNTEDNVIEPPAPSLRNLEAAVPRENMADVLDLLQEPNLATTSAKRSAWRFWQIIPALIALFLLIKLIGRFLIPALSPSREKIAATSAIKSLKAESDPIAFLKQSAQFTQLLPAGFDDLKKEITTQRDQACFQPDKSNVQLNKGDRSSILKKLSTAAKQLVLIGMLSLCFISESQAESPAEYHASAMSAVAEKDYATALSSYLNAYPDLNFPADVLYNMGTLYAKLDEPGQAMLYYRRALLQTPSHAEAKQNLNYMERVHGSIVIRRSGIYHFLSKIPLSAVKTTLYVLGWSFLCLLLALPLCKKSSFRTLVLAKLLLCAFLIPLTIAAILVYPNDGKFCPTHEMAIITAPEAISAKTGAADDAELVITAPPGSTAKVLLQRGLWAYLELSDSTRAWVDTKNLSMLAPQDNFETITPVESKSDL